MAMNCRHCNSDRIIFVKRMRNVDKYNCRKCNRNTFFPIPKNERNPPRTGSGYNRRRYAHIPVHIAPPNSFVCFNHQDKGNAYVRALQGVGYNKLENRDFQKGLEIVLTDSDIMGRKAALNKMRNLGAKTTFLIPHTARPNLVNDIEDGWEHTTAQFVVSRGHKEIMESYGFDKPIHPVGWTLCQIRKFKPRKEPRNVLFAPIHPRCSKVDQDVNAETFKRLEKLARSDDIILTVRYIKNLWDSGLKQVNHPNIRYVPGYMGQEDATQLQQLNEADVSVGHQTFAWKSVSYGIPTVMMAERSLPTHIQKRGGSVQYARNWNKYVDLLAYPLDILETDDTLGLLRRAVSSDEEIKDWRRRMIGYPFRAKRFIEIVKSYL